MIVFQENLFGAQFDKFENVYKNVYKIT